MSLLCLNMIVKNELAIIDRCLESVAPFIDRYVICDTGSIDGTQDRIRTVMSRFRIPGEIHQIPFHNFEQARNEALAHAKVACGAKDYLLLCDADMELVVEDREFREKLDHGVFTVAQANVTTYFNVRVIRADLDARYIGVTHEYLSAPIESRRFDGIRFIDHANGANRSEKFERDIRLLTEDLELHPDEPRSLFYLAQSYKDAGKPELAIPFYERRVAAGGWVEEVWYARYMIAECHRRLGNEAEFVRAAWDAYDARPARAEPLLRLAEFYREHGKHDTCLAVCDVGESIPYPSDSLFVEQDAYGHAFAWNRSICGFYSELPKRRDAGRDACYRLTTDRSISADERWRSLNNATYYLRDAAQIFGSVVMHKLDIELPAGRQASNPSVSFHNGRRWCIVRSVNYELLDGGGYRFVGDDIVTTNCVVELDDNYRIVQQIAIDESGDPGPVFPSRIIGFEDCRLFWVDDRPWCSATVRERNPENRNEIVILQLDETWTIRRVDVQRSYEPHLYQKNWMPFVKDGRVRHVYKMDPLTILEFDPQSGQSNLLSISSLAHLDLTAFRGGSQLVAIENDWVAITHEVAQPNEANRFYLHRFVRFDRDLAFVDMTEPFYFRAKGIEYCAGLTLDTALGELVASFGVNDGEAWLARFNYDAVMRQFRFR